MARWAAVELLSSDHAEEVDTPSAVWAPDKVVNSEHPNQKLPVTEETDIWAFGMTALEVSCSKPRSDS
jgi:hypothetical protein